MKKKNISKAVSYTASRGNVTLDLMVPEEKFIKLLIYRGCRRDEIKKILRDLNLYPLAASDLEAIIVKCRSTKEIRKIIKENQSKLAAGETLHTSENVRKEFEFPEVFDSMMKLPKNSDFLQALLNEQIITNSDKRRFLECSILFALPSNRFISGWKKKFDKELDETEFKQFRYYFWNIENYNQNKCEALIDDHPEYQFHVDFRYIYGFSLVNFLSYFSIASPEEILNHERKLFETEEAARDERFDRDLNSYSEKMDLQFIRRKKRYNKLLPHLEKAEYWSKKLERTFARIVGKTRYNLTRDLIKNRKRVTWIAEDD
ncbi:MAG: hypothetical protein PF570_05575 [Candidatus Cloacimonetes bacterium]|jgi:hypothetical protein|nr:hypothetical protein [Candidatus Cloacimonadota bacterium]